MRPSVRRSPSRDLDDSREFAAGFAENGIRLDFEYDRDGQLLETWTGFAPYGLAWSNEGVLYVATGRENDVLGLDASGKVIKRWGRKGTAPGEFDLPHMLSFDAKGHLYVAEVGGMRFVLPTHPCVAHFT